MKPSSERIGADVHCSNRYVPKKVNAAPVYFVPFSGRRTCSCSSACGRLGSLLDLADFDQVDVRDDEQNPLGFPAFWDHHESGMTEDSDFFIWTLQTKSGSLIRRSIPKPFFHAAVDSSRLCAYTVR